MEKRILKFYNPVLRKKAKKVDLDKKTEELITEMKNVMKERDGIGLAAPQIGESKRIIIAGNKEEIVTLLNPEIKEKGKEEIVTKEGCLSLPGVWLDVARPRYIKIKALDENGREFEGEAEDIFAVVLQHEIDHLDGKLFIDRVGFFTKIKTLFRYFFQRIFPLKEKN